VEKLNKLTLEIAQTTCNRERENPLLSVFILVSFLIAAFGIWLFGLEFGSALGLVVIVIVCAAVSLSNAYVLRSSPLPSFALTHTFRPRIGAGPHCTMLA
jgi:hypothetical protein